MTSAAEEPEIWLLCQFYHRYLDFRLSEVEALADLAGCGGQIQWRKPFGGDSDGPFWYIRVPSLDAARRIAQRSLLIKVLVELWGEGSSFEEMRSDVASRPLDQVAQFIAPGTTFKVEISSFGSKVDTADREAALAAVGTLLPWEGKVSLAEPQNTFWYIRQQARSSLASSPLALSPDVPTEDATIGRNGLPPRFFFGREISRGDRSLIETLILRKRRYLGPTSMDTEMALLIANQANIQRGSLVLDPFVGTGSMLVAAAARGAYVLGADIDIRVLKGMGKRCKKTGEPVDILTNFADYNLKSPLGLLRWDLHCAPFRRGMTEVLHAIVADPPYGVRAGGRKSGGRKKDADGKAFAVPEGLREGHFPSTAPYPLSECLDDLLDVAARLLVLNGRLVYFFPAAVSEYSVRDLPSHPCLELLADSEDRLSIRFSRRLVTMRKVRAHYDGARAEAAATTSRQRAERNAELVAAGREVVSLDDLREHVFFPDGKEDRGAIPPPPPSPLLE